MKGVDASFSALPPGWAAARKAEGQEVFVQCLWTGGYANNNGIRAVAEANLRQAREAGLITAGYLNTNPWFAAPISIMESKKNAGVEWAHLSVVFNDIEIGGVTEEQCRSHTEAIVAEGKRTAIYSANWFWQSMGNPKWPWLLQYGLWIADYDNDPSFATAKLFGPWKQSDIIGKQYTNTTNLAGVNVDFNEFQFFEEDDMFTDADRELLDAIADRLLVVDTQLDTVESALLADPATDKETEPRRIIQMSAKVKRIDDGQ